MGRKSAHEVITPEGRTNGTHGSFAMGNGGYIHLRVHDRLEEYACVTRDDLRASMEFNVLAQFLFGVGTFFLGALWPLVELLAHQERFEPTSWMAVCGLSIAFGLTLATIGLRLLWLKHDRLKKYFPPQRSDGANGASIDNSCKSARNSNRRRKLIS
jgi:hypothetical protein